MTQHELMIGDWVLDGNNVAQITSITCDGIIETSFNETSNIEVIHPIPLTPEILKKNGFVKASMISDMPPYDKDEEGNMHFNLNEKFWGWWQPDNTFLIPANGLGWLEFRYAHELQHALRLCNIDKEIVL